MMKKSINFTTAIIFTFIAVIIIGCTPAPAPAPVPRDSDGDGWSDSQEREAGTDIHNVDTDDDGYWDPQDGNPLNPNIPRSTASVPTSVPKPTEAPEPTEAPAPQKSEKVIIYASSSSWLSKAKSYSWETGLNIDVITNKEKLKESLISNEYAGIYYTKGLSIPDWLILDLSKYVRSGGRAFIEIGINQDDNAITMLQDYFEVSIAKELVRSTGGMESSLYHPGERFTPLWNNLTVGFPEWPGRGWRLDGFFNTRDNSSIVTGEIRSQTSGLMRAISAYKRDDTGEILFLMITSYGERGGGSVIHDDIIDYYDNKQGSLNIIEWLAGKRKYNY